MKVGIGARVSTANYGQDPAMQPMGATNLIELPAPVVKPRRAPRTRSVFLTPEETLAVFRAAKDRGVRAWAMILPAYRHGLRASEVCGLRLADVNFKDGAVTVARLKGSMRTVQPLYSHRGQPLLDEVAALRSWLKARPADGSDCLLTSQKGAGWTARNSFACFRLSLRTPTCQRRNVSA